jgi:hypothetical protein
VCVESIGTDDEQALVVQDAGMVSYLVAPTEAGSWLVDVEAFDSWLRSRWPVVETTSHPGELQRTNMWTWPDLYEVWVPDDRRCAWLDADAERIAAVAAWLAASATQSLTLCDEGYSMVIDLNDLSEAVVLDRLRAS